MVTKTLTITEDAYQLLAGKKLANESFSEEIRRLFSHKKPRLLSEFFGILSEEEGEGLQRDLEKIRDANKKLARLA